MAAPNLLVYGKGGYTNARYNIESSFDGDEGAKIDMDGFRIGKPCGIRAEQQQLRQARIPLFELQRRGTGFRARQRVRSDLGEIDLDRHQVPWVMACASDRSYRTENDWRTMRLWLFCI